MEDFEYDLKDTPCNNVFGQHFCLHQGNVQQEFPKDQLLIDMDINSYAGGPLFSQNGEPMGIIAVLSNQPLKHVELTELLLQILGIRCAAELERLRATDELNQYQTQLRALASEVIIAEEQERRRIAVELHDEVIQDLGLSKIKLGELSKFLANNKYLYLVNETRKLIERIIKESRTLVFDLSSPILYELGYEAAVKWLAEQTENNLGIPCRVQDDGQPKPMNKEMQVLLFKAVRELMINISKHAQAKTVDIFIRRAGDVIEVSVRDDGAGFDPDQIKLAGSNRLKFGLFGIMERLNLLNGKVIISSSPDCGTNITLTAPLTLND